MGEFTFTKDAYLGATARHTTAGKSATARGEEQVRVTGKLDPLVDPAEYGVVRESRIRLEERSDGLWVVTVGTPVPIEYRLDTTGSMGDNVDRALKALPDICGLASAVLPERDPFYCASIFGDLADVFSNGAPGFPLCRGQFECEAEKMVNQLTLMHPMRQGHGNGGEDPHYGLFASAFLTRAYFRMIGLRSYDFTTTDEPMHEPLIASQLVRIFGPEVFEKAQQNGFQINARNLPANGELVKELLKHAHAFVLLVNSHHGSGLRQHWVGYFGKQHVVVLPQIELVPHVMATIIGLTEGTIDLRSAKDFLAGSNLPKSAVQSVIDSVAHIPLGAQAALPNFGRMPKKGDVFAKKTDLWPLDPKDVPQGDPGVEPTTPPVSGGWL